MKKHFSKALALLLVVVMALSVCPVQVSAAFGMSKTAGHTVQSGVTYAKYSVTSGQNGNTLACTTLTFNPANGFIPMAFQGYAGTSGTLATQYSIATNKYGYNVAGVINGSFFSMGTPYGTLTGISISNGKVVAGHLGSSGEVVAFGSDGSMKVVSSNLKYTLNIGGKDYADMIYYINKTSGSASASNWSDRFYYFDTSCGTKCDSYSVCPGTEILCKKVDNTDLAVGQTLVGEVVSVTKNTYGGALGESGVYADTFILFMKSGSSYESYISGVKAGDTITINTEESVAASREVMEKANSVISNVGWLVKDGVDRTRIDSTIGTHSVTLQARWTAFGQKADGSYVFFTSEGGSTGSGGSLTLRDVADAMEQMGCVNVIRMDGGGSSAMYVSNTGSGSAGYVQSSSRAIADCILIVSRSSATKSAVKTALQTKITEAEGILSANPSTALQTAITQAKTIYNSNTSIMGDHKRAIMELRELGSGKAMLQSALSAAASVNTTLYSDLALDRIDYAYKEGSRIVNSSAYTEVQKMQFAAKINALLNDTSSTADRISLGAAYDTHDANTAYPDTGLREMTDGILFDDEAMEAAWTGYQSSAAHGYIEGKGNYTDIKVDLGAVKNITGFGVSVLHYTGWGISAPNAVEIYAGEDGNSYYYHSSLSPVIVTAEANAYQVIPYESISSTVTTDRYIIFRIFFASSHLFVGEVSVYGDGGADSSNFTSFNTRINTDNAVIFTGSLGTLTASNANLTWSRSIICNYDSAKGAYVVSSVYSANGDSTYTCTVPTGGIVIGLHGAAYNNNASARAAKAGDIVCLTGIDVAEQIVYPGARISFVSPASESVSYAQPAIGVVAPNSGSACKDDSFVSLPAMNMTDGDIANLFLDCRVTVKGNSTGATVTVKATGETYQLYYTGDINGDSVVNTADLLAVRKEISGQNPMSGVYYFAGDMDDSGNVNTTDLVIIRRFLETH